MRKRLPSTTGNTVLAFSGGWWRWGVQSAMPFIKSSWNSQNPQKSLFFLNFLLFDEMRATVHTPPSPGAAWDAFHDLGVFVSYACVRLSIRFRMHTHALDVVETFCNRFDNFYFPHKNHVFRKFLKIARKSLKINEFWLNQATQGGWPLVVWEEQDEPERW